MRVDIDGLTRALDDRLAGADAALAEQFPGDRPGRQPVHTVYVPADRYNAVLVPRWGAEAAKALDDNHALFDELVADEHIVELIRAKLDAEPIEDLRIDFEDGYGARPDDEEDAHVVAAARAFAESQRAMTAPPFYGIRIKSFEAPTRARGVRTLALFLAELTESNGTPGVVTLPKVTSVDQVTAMVFACRQIETDLDVDPIGFEIQVETPQSVLGPDGTALVARMIHAAEGRCTALHYGTYDYSAFCGIAATYQSMAHPVADYAKLVMQAAAAGTGVRLSDGSTNILPIGDNIRAGWQLHLDLVRRSLERGYYQGWDLHPAQLPTRYAATFGFYRRDLPQALVRLGRYVRRESSAILDEPATARALADFTLRALHCGATGESEITDLAGLTSEQVTQLARPGR